jgi:DTW domain-containing protein YfiP
MRTAHVAPHHVALLLHHKEAGRSSNTGILLTKAVNASLHVAGLMHHEEALSARLAASPATAILWPGEGALSVEEWRASLAPGAFEAGCTLVAVDATWNSARRMVKRLPESIPRIALPPESFLRGKSLLDPVRKYAGTDAAKHCTYEATLAALVAMGVLPGDTRDALLLNLKCKVDALLVYKNRRTVYQSETGIVKPSKGWAKAQGAGAAGALTPGEDDDEDSSG